MTRLTPAVATIAAAALLAGVAWTSTGDAPLAVSPDPRSRVSEVVHTVPAHAAERGPWPVASPHAALEGEASRDLPGRIRHVWPSGAEAEVLRGFEAPGIRWGAGHRGVDLELPVGAEVLASADGVVSFAGWVVDRSVVSIDHADGIRTTYEPLTPEVEAGDLVTAGQRIGTLTGGHCELTGCLHWGARRGQHDYLDPLELLGNPVVIRLFPEESTPAAG